MATNQIKQKVQIRQKKTSEIRISLFLDWYDGNNKRTKEYLGLFLIANPKNPIERQSNKDTLVFAELKRAERESQLFKGEVDEILEQKTVKSRGFIPYFENYVLNYSKKDLRVMKAVLAHFKIFAPPHITTKDITEQLCYDFKDYLSKNLTGESPPTYFARFKKMLHQAKRDKIFRTNPAEDVKNFKTDVSIAKDVLTIEELQVLANTHCGNESVKRAFLFCCNTGLRFVDVKALKWENIKDNVLKVEQSKTKDKATDGGVVEITLNDTAIKLLGTPTDKEDVVFNLPTHNSTVKSLDYWAKRGGIEKHITFHVARHTFGTLLAHYETDVITISKLLGHTTLKHTSKYIRTSNEMKQKAVNSIPTISLN
jgi:integrase/recombinase XerD